MTKRGVSNLLKIGNNPFYSYFKRNAFWGASLPVPLSSHAAFSTGSLAKSMQGMTLKKRVESRSYTTLSSSYSQNKPLQPHKETMLLSAIQNGDLHAPIFKEADCYLYLLSFMKKNVPQAMTAYAYLMALMQFTETQALHPQDAKVKIKGRVIVEKLVDQGTLTQMGESYLDALCQRLAKINYKIDYRELVGFVTSLPSLEQCIIHVSHPREQHTDIEFLSEYLTRNFPLLQGLSTDEEIAYRIPSASIKNYILQKMTPSPVNMQPILGVINFNEYFQLHLKNQHPVALYAPAETSNAVKLHGREGGPLMMYLHDCGHAFWGSMLCASERQMIFNHYVPCLQAIKQEMQKQQDEKAIAKMDGLIEDAVDLDLTEIAGYQNPEKRLVYYAVSAVAKSLALPDSSKKHLPIGACAEDRVLFFLYKMRHSVPEQHLAFWKEITDIVQSYIIMEDNRSYVVMCALPKAGYLAVHEDELKSPAGPEEIQWDAWVEAFSETQDSQKLWQFATSEHRRYELCTLIEESNLAFFHPYLPMTAEKHEKVKTFLEKQLLLKTPVPSARLC
jgi:hypothetical protein